MDASDIQNTALAIQTMHDKHIDLPPPSAPPSTLPLDDMNVDSPLSPLPDDELPDMLHGPTPPTTSGSNNLQLSLGPGVVFGKGTCDVDAASIAMAESASPLLHGKPEPKLPKKFQDKKLSLKGLGSAANPIDLSQLCVGNDVVEVIDLTIDDVCCTPPAAHAPFRLTTTL